jgi:vacuolar-type H+-ATPase subunit F/Vma7
MRVAVLGDKETVLGFAFAGIKEYRLAEDYESAKRAFAELLGTQDIILVTQKIADLLRAEIDKLRSPYPLVVEVPAREKVIREDTVNRLVRRAIGVVPPDLAFTEE